MEVVSLNCGPRLSTDSECGECFQLFMQPGGAKVVVSFLEDQDSPYTGFPAIVKFLTRCARAMERVSQESLNDALSSTRATARGGKPAYKK